ncbi:hypothetical protein ACFOM8_21915 [Paracoccus angustae]|uniref:Uncharacterized protein n=1 Tax=Paracoccus angustae TaxID=1671480 RepID=A0ABV7UAR9_9RHOB
MSEIINAIGGFLGLIGIIAGVWGSKRTDAQKSLPIILFGLGAMLIVLGRLIQ